MLFTYCCFTPCVLVRMIFCIYVAPYICATFLSFHVLVCYLFLPLVFPLFSSLFLRIFISGAGLLGIQF